MGVVIPTVSRAPVVIKIRVDSVSETRERLDQFSTAVALAMGVLVRANNRDDEAVLDRVADVLRSGPIMCQRCKSPSFEGVVETGD